MALSHNGPPQSICQPFNHFYDLDVRGQVQKLLCLQNINKKSLWKDDNITQSTYRIIKKVNVCCMRPLSVSVIQICVSSMVTHETLLHRSDVLFLCFQTYHLHFGISQVPKYALCI